MVENHIFFDNPELNLDLVLQKFLEGKLYAFHGTSEIYSKDIELKGFQRKWMPTNEATFLKLIKCLDQIGVPEILDNGHPSIRTRLNNYLLRRTSSPLSFTYTGYESLFYATDLRKGGQILMGIREAFDLIEGWHKENKKYLRLFLFKLSFIKLYYLLRRVKQKKGCIYIVEFEPEDLGMLKHSQAVNAFGAFFCIQTSIEIISPRKIIGKIVIENNITVNTEIYMSAIVETRNKMQRRGTLAFRLLENKLRS